MVDSILVWLIGAGGLLGVVLSLAVWIAKQWVVKRLSRTKEEAIERMRAEFNREQSTHTLVAKAHMEAASAYAQHYGQRKAVVEEAMWVGLQEFRAGLDNMVQMMPVLNWQGIDESKDPRIREFLERIAPNAGKLNEGRVFPWEADLYLPREVVQLRGLILLVLTFVRMRFVAVQLVPGEARQFLDVQTVIARVRELYPDISDQETVFNARIPWLVDKMFDDLLASLRKEKVHGDIEKIRRFLEGDDIPDWEDVAIDLDLDVNDLRRSVASPVE